MRDDVDVEAAAADAVDRQTHAADAYGSLGRHEAHQRRRQLELQAPGARILIGADQRSDRIDVAAHQMTAEGIAGAQARFQVQARTVLEPSQGRLGEGLARYVGAENRPIEARHGETDALDAHAVADREAPCPERGGIDAQLEVAALGECRHQPAGGDDNSGKHPQCSFGCALRGVNSSRTSPPTRCTSANSNNGGRRPFAARPLKAVSGGASAPSKIGATYKINSSTRFASRNAAASRGPHSTQSSLTSRNVKRSTTAARSNPRPAAGTTSTLKGGAAPGADGLAAERRAASGATNTSAPPPAKTFACGAHDCAGSSTTRSGCLTHGP